MNAIEKNGPRIADLEFPVYSLFKDEDVVVAFRLSGRADGPAPAIEAYGRTSHFDRDLDDWADDTVLVPLDVTDVRLEDGPPYPALAFRVRARVDCDPAVAIVTWP